MCWDDPSCPDYRLFARRPGPLYYPRPTIGVGIPLSKLGLPIGESLRRMGRSVHPSYLPSRPWPPASSMHSKSQKKSHGHHQSKTDPQAKPDKEQQDTETCHLCKEKSTIKDGICSQCGRWVGCKKPGGHTAWVKCRSCRHRADLTELVFGVCRKCQQK